MPTNTTTTGSDLQLTLLQTFADILDLATAESDSMDQAAGRLSVIEDKVAAALRR